MVSRWVQFAIDLFIRSFVLPCFSKQKTAWDDFPLAAVNWGFDCFSVYTLIQRRAAGLRNARARIPIP